MRGRRLSRRFHGYRYSATPQMEGQDLHLDQGADEADRGKASGRHPCFAQGQPVHGTKGPQHRHEARHVACQT
ncbi:hypothetical protein [Streptomyces sp. NPDC001422]|uniref:hypothetical protein n=1 Tax=Streptomyces sp. NPDC001422 TaxID=3364575 RepID=UPI0036BD4CF7